jgi:hypothetical protein
MAGRFRHYKFLGSCFFRRADYKWVVSFRQTVVL